MPWPGGWSRYQYFSGRLALYEDNFADASERLQWAFAHCHRGARRNRQSILRFLVPIQLLTGKLPTAQLLQKYELFCYEDVAEAVRDGNLQQFELAMVENYDQFVRDGGERKSSSVATSCVMRAC